MKENEEYRVDTRLINLKKECIWVISKWKWIVALTIVMSICAVAWKYVVDYRANQVAYEEALQKQKTSSVDYLAEQMTAEQMITINRAFSCWMQSIGASEYLEHSILIRENPYEMDMAYIYLEYITEDRNEVSKYVHSTEFFESLQSDLGWDTEECYLRELITEYDESVRYAFSVTAADQADCEMLAQAVINLISQNCSASVQSGYYILDIVIDLDLVERYNQVYDNWAKNSDRIISYEKLLSVSELAVLKEMMLDYLGDSESQEEVTEIVLAKTTLNMKMFVIGALVGLILSMVLLFIYYTLSPFIHGKEELLALFHLNVFGELDAKSQDVEYLATNIVLSCKKNMVRTVYMSGTKVSELSEDIYKQIEAALQSSQIQLIRGEDITKNAKSLTKMIQVGACVIIERDENSKCTVIADEMNICSRNQVQVLGAILLKA